MFTCIKSDSKLFSNRPELLINIIVNFKNPLWKNVVELTTLNRLATAGGGGAKWPPLRVFAKYLKNGLVNLYETL